MPASSGNRMAALPSNFPRHNPRSRSRLERSVRPFLVLQPNISRHHLLVPQRTLC